MSLADFTSAMYLHAVFEVDLMRSVERYRKRLRSAERKLRDAVAQRVEMAGWVSEQVRAAVAADAPVEREKAFARKREDIEREQAEVREKITALQKKFVEYDAEWKRRESGSDQAEFLGEIGTYRATVLRINEGIEALTDEVVQLEKEKRPLRGR